MYRVLKCVCPLFVLMELKRKMRQVGTSLHSWCTSLC
jgi:hypothetical protein